MLTVQPSIPPLFIWRGDYKTKDVPKAAGFRWNPDLRHWWTNDATKAQRLTQYATPEALTALAPVTTALAESRASGPLMAADAPLVDIPLPTGVKLLPYQAAGVQALLKRPNALLADEPGLGKTIQAICVKLNARPDIKRVLIVCPAYLKLNWAIELDKFSTRKELTVGHATTKVVPDTDIIVAHYDVFSRACPSRDALKDIAFDAAIFDESTALKHPDSARCQHSLGYERKGKPSIRGINAREKLFLSGTPATSRPIELFPVLHALDPVAWPSFVSFAYRYCAAQKTRFGFDVSGSSHSAELQDRLRSTVMVRRLKADVLTELPPKQRQVIEIDAEDGIDPADATFLARIKAEQSAVEAAKDDAVAYAEAVRKLNASLASFDEISALRLSIAKRKLPAILAHVQDALDSGEKVVLFGHHKEILNAIAEAFNVQACHGDMPQADRQAAVEAFQAGQTSLIVCGYYAMGMGVTLTAARLVIVVECDWLPAIVQQAEDRCHRIGQRDSVLVQHLVLNGSLDAYMAKMVVSKQAVLDAVLDTSTAITVDLPEPAAPRAESTPTAPTLPAAQVAAVHANLRALAGVCDGAQEQDGQGFNGLDSAFGKSLARQARLSDRQALAARKMLAKYKGQLGPEATAAMFD